MNKMILMMGLILAVSAPAMAQERQVYSPYPQPTFQNSTDGGAMAYQYQQTPNHYMVYPGREQYGQRYGYMPRHPGDYRDAVDRGSWTGGGGARMPRRSYNGY
jgi:hypothetical protein